MVDLFTGVGLPAAIEGADSIVHAASDPRGDARVTGVKGTRWLAHSGIPVSYVPIVGVDVHPYKYYRIKREGGRTLSASGFKRDLALAPAGTPTGAVTWTDYLSGSVGLVSN